MIATTQRIPLEKVKPDSTFEELGIDSMDSINILFDLESEFDIEIKDEDAKKIQTIREMIDGVTYLVDAKQNPSPSPQPNNRRLPSGKLRCDPRYARVCYPRTSNTPS